VKWWQYERSNSSAHPHLTHLSFVTRLELMGGGGVRQLQGWREVYEREEAREERGGEGVLLGRLVQLLVVVVQTW